MVIRMVRHRRPALRYATGGAFHAAAKGRSGDDQKAAIGGKGHKRWQLRFKRRLDAIIAAAYRPDGENCKVGAPAQLYQTPLAPWCGWPPAEISFTQPSSSK